MFKLKDCDRCYGGKAEFDWRDMQYQPCRKCDGTGHEEPTQFHIFCLELFWRWKDAYSKIITTSKQDRE